MSGTQSPKEELMDWYVEMKAGVEKMLDKLREEELNPKPRVTPPPSPRHQWTGDESEEEDEDDGEIEVIMEMPDLKSMTPEEREAYNKRWKECGYCRSINKPEDQWRGHTKEECKILANTRCNYCAGYGHTGRYCENKPDDGKPLKIGCLFCFRGKQDKDVYMSHTDNECVRKRNYFARSGRSTPSSTASSDSFKPTLNGIPLCQCSQASTTKSAFDNIHYYMGELDSALRQNSHFRRNRRMNENTDCVWRALKTLERGLDIRRFEDTFGCFCDDLWHYRYAARGNDVERRISAVWWGISQLKGSQSRPAQYVVRTKGDELHANVVTNYLNHNGCTWSVADRRNRYGCSL